MAVTISITINPITLQKETEINLLTHSIHEFPNAPIMEKAKDIGPSINRICRNIICIKKRQYITPFISEMTTHMIFSCSHIDALDHHICVFMVSQAPIWASTPAKGLKLNPDCSAFLFCEAN